jgi:hypothetical protein
MAHSRVRFERIHCVGQPFGEVRGGGELLLSLLQASAWKRRISPSASEIKIQPHLKLRLTGEIIQILTEDALVAIITYRQ